MPTDVSERRPCLSGGTRAPFCHRVLNPYRDEAFDLSAGAGSRRTHPSFREASRFRLKLGFISFGGPTGQIAIMQRELVENKKMDRPVALLARAQLLHAAARIGGAAARHLRPLA